jgi:hypothetical protein
MQDPIPKLTKAKRSEGVVQVVECLIGKHKVLSSNTTTAKNKIGKGFE